MKQLKEISILQDNYLKELNTLAGLPEETKYNKARQKQKTKVSREIYNTMLWSATDYITNMFDTFRKAYFNNKIALPTPNISQNVDWAYDVLEKYYEEQK